MRAALLHGFATLLATLLAIVAALAAYHHWIVRPALRVGIVDLGEVYRLKEAEFTLTLTKPGSDDER